MKLVRGLTLVAIGSALFLVPAAAQETLGIIGGRVTDSSGAIVPGAKVVATNQQTNTTAEAVTSEGNYTMLYLLPGTYAVSVEAPGFKRLNRSGIELRVADRVSIDLQLEIGGQTETVSVASQAPLLEVSSASAGQVIDRRRIAELPLAEGNPLTLIQLAPGIVITGGFTSNSALSNSGPSNFESGGSPGGNEFTLDGSPNTADRQGNGAARVGLQPPPTRSKSSR